MHILTPVKNNKIIIYCPHKNCGGWAEIDINELIKKKRVESICNRVHHKIVIILDNIAMIRIKIEEEE